MAILTVSREYGSGGREIGRAVSDILNYEYIDKEKMLDEIRKTGKKWEEWGKDFDEHCPTVWEKYDWSFRGFGALLENVILEYALKDRAVIMGRGGNFLLRDIPHALKIRVIAPIENRVERIVARESVDRGTAHWLAGKIDNERKCFINSLYGKNWDESSAYDLIFDTGTKTLEEIVEIIKDAVSEKEKFNNEESQKILRMKALAARVKAGILTDPHFFIPTLDVYHDGTSIILRGITHTPKEHKRIEDAARKLAGDVPLKCELHYRK